MLLHLLWVGGLVGVGYAAFCETPSVLHGLVDGKGDTSSWTGTFSCQPGYTLVGHTRLKCRGGQWSGDIPVCTVLDGCHAKDLPEISNGRKYSYKTSRYRGGVYKYSCHKGFARVGPSLVWCDEGTWNFGGETPLCAKPGCDEGMVEYIHHGKATKKHDGAIFSFSCDVGGVLDGPSLVYCDGNEWSSSPPQCFSPTSRPALSIEVDGNISPNIAAGDLITAVCNAKGGNPIPTLSLFKDKKPIGNPREGQNLHTFLAKPADNKATLSCAAINSMMRAPLLAEVVLNILYGPSSVSISSPPSPQPPGQTATLSCNSSSSNPPSVVHWSVVDSKGREVDNVDVEPDTTTTWAGSGWVTSSTLKLRHVPNIRFVNVQCTATNTALQHKVKDNVVVTMMSSTPTTVTITSQPQQAVPGESVKVKCVSSPSATPTHLDWVVMQDGEKEEYRPEEKMDQNTEGYWKTTSELEFIAGDGDEVVVECLARHEVAADDTVAHVHVIKIGHSKMSKKSQIIEESPPQEVESKEVQKTGENIGDVNLEEDLSIKESTSIINEDDELISKETTVGTKELMENRKEEASAVKDSKLMNTSSKQYLSLFCNILCYLLLLF